MLMMSLCVMVGVANFRFFVGMVNCYSMLIELECIVGFAGQYWKVLVCEEFSSSAV